MIGRRRPVVPEELLGRIEAALAAVDEANAALTRVVASEAPLLARRAAHADLRHAFADADALLRQATALAREGSYRDWSRWRHRLSTLGSARQRHLLAERDDSGVLPSGSTRALDTGMSGPDIGDLMHGRSCAPGTRPSYGVDVEALLTAPGGNDRKAEPGSRESTADRPPATPPVRDVSVARRPPVSVDAAEPGPTRGQRGAA